MDDFNVMGDFHIDMRQTSPESHKRDEFCSLFSIKNKIKSDIYFTKFHSSITDLFQNTNTVETGRSNHHKLICTF